MREPAAGPAIHDGRKRKSYGGNNTLSIVFKMSTLNSSLRIAVLQSAGIEGDVEGNLRALAAAAGRARSLGADLLITPEMFVTGYNIGERLDAVVTDDLPDRIRTAVRHSGLATAVGTGVRRPDGIANSVLLIDADGSLIARYDKTHLFGALDRALFVAGDTLGPVISFRGVRLAMLICYDVEFPENVRALALAGAQLVIVPTAQMEPYEFIAEHLLRVRAWENQIAIAYANRVGSEGRLRYVGRSSIVDADGLVLAHAGAAEEDLLFATIDAGAVERSRSRNPYLLDRRPDLAVSPVPRTNPLPEEDDSHDRIR